MYNYKQEETITDRVELYPMTNCSQAQHANPQAKFHLLLDYKLYILTLQHNICWTGSLHGEKVGLGVLHGTPV
jgi:hypothetical protein